jgi:DNA primase
MAINPEKMLSWVESRFDDYVISGNEIKINSIFVEDHKRHLWINPTGGKKQRENGVFRCFKTDKRGSCVTLVMLVDKCSYQEAIEILDAVDMSLANMEAQVEEMFNPPVVPETTPLEDNTLKLPPFTSRIDELDTEDFYRTQAETYLLGRKLSPTGLMVCIGGEYRNRIIIPYYDRHGDLIYFNGRSMSTHKDALRYLGPPKSVGIGKEDVIYVPEWPQNKATLWLTEGEFDALAIYQASRITGDFLFSGAFGGKSLSDKQVELIRPYSQIVLCLDADSAGKSGLIAMSQKLREKGLVASYVRPPQQYKDWNKMLEVMGEKILVHYLLRNRKALDELELMRLMS